MIQTELRNADLQDLAALLQQQQARKIDMVVPASKLSSEGGVLVVRGADAQLTEDGVTEVDGRYLPTAVCDEGVADKLGIPLAYVRKLRTERPDLYDANVNGWLRGTIRSGVPTPDAMTGYSLADLRDGADVAVPADPRSFLLRGFRSDEDGGTGIGRALLSDRYARIDNLDVLVAALDGIQQAGADTHIVGCDLTERNMRVRVVAPQVQAEAEALLAEYRSPFRDPAVDAQRRHNAVADAVRAMETYGRHSGLVTDPVVFAGFELGNSETGGGAFQIVPRIVFRVCNNGATLTADAMRSVHVGGKLDEGLIRWTEDTQRKAVQLVTAKTRDAVATFLSPGYLRAQIEKLEQQAGVPVRQPQETIERLGKALTYDQGTIALVLDHFIRGGQMTAAGVLNAVTSAAQVVADADKAADLEASAIRAMGLAASYA